MRLTVACLGVVTMAASAFARPEPNAFLNHVAPNLSALIVQVQKDPEVYARYAKHFGMSKTQLISYFSTLKPSKIAKTGIYTVYNIREDGIVRSRLFHLKSGSLIYIDAVGRPILKKLCGNPMAMSPTKLSAVNLIQDVPLAPPTDLKPMAEQAPEAETPNEVMVAEELAMPPVEASVTPVAPTVDVPPTVVPEVKPSFEVAPPLGGGWILPLIGGAVAFAGGGGGGGDSVVPEPATLGATVTLIGLYAASRKRKR